MLIFYRLGKDAQGTQGGAIEDEMMESSSEPSGEGRVTLACDPGAAWKARRFVDHLLRRRQASERLVETALLVSSELVTNAYQHGVGEIELRVHLLVDRLRIEVIDQGHDQAPAVRDESHHEVIRSGLQIVEKLALQWGAFEGTIHVWADLAWV